MPKLLTTPFATDAPTSLRTDIQESTGASPNSATYQQGFPEDTMKPIASGGIPPKGSDFNGIFYDITENIVFQTKGGRYGFDSAYAAKIGGYPAGAVLQLNDGTEAISTIASNTNNPNVDLTGWVKTNSSDRLTFQLKQGAPLQTIYDKLKEQVSVKDFGAIGDGTLHTLQEWVDSGRFSNLTAIQVVYPNATALTDSIDSIACQAAIDYVGKGGSVLFNQTTANTYVLDRPLYFYGGQTWIGCGGVDVLGTSTKLKLVAAATSVAEPKTPSSTTYGFKAKGIYFNAQTFGDNGLSLYNSSYSLIEQCAANSSKTNGCGFLFDSDTSKQCYFNILQSPRAFAAATGGAAFRFVRGANANQIFGGKAGSSYRGAEFLTLSSGNLIVATDFEENTNCHIYNDVSNNCFIATHMENAPIGFNITVNGWGTRRFGTTFASTVTTPVQDASLAANTLDYTQDGVGTLQNGNLKQLVSVLSTVVNTNHDINLALGTEAINFNFFRNTNSSSTTKKITWYRADGSATEAFSFDLTNGDIAQTSSTGNRRVLRRAAAAPTTGTWSTGDKVLRTNPNTTNSVVTEWTCVTAGTPGTWAATAWYTGRGTTAQRPTGLTSSDAGVQYFDNTLAAAGKPIWWNGGTWVDATGTIV